mgnify:CR=1 FL=1
MATKTTWITPLEICFRILLSICGVTLDLQPTPKLLDTVRDVHPDLTMVGFKAETSGDDDAIAVSAPPTASSSIGGAVARSSGTLDHLLERRCGRFRVISGRDS